MRPRLLWAVWTLLILSVTTLPWSYIQDHPHWTTVVWNPCADTVGDTLDVIANVLLFLPYGYLGVRSLPTLRWRLAWVLVSGLLLSTGVELLQVFSHYRYGSVTDLVTNGSGTALGGLVAYRRSRLVSCCSSHRNG